jgi:PadR family transcriptional regulator, regulatory protein PadR
MLDSYEQKLLSAWEEVYKKGQLTLWILLALKDGPKHMQEIKTFIETVTNGTLTADDKSMYRALRRYADAELVNFTAEPGGSGPDRKIYALSASGKKVLGEFLDRNIKNVFFNKDIKELLK